MPRYPSFISTSTRFAAIVVLSSLVLCVSAQKFIPTPVARACGAFLPGKGHYVIGGSLSNVSQVAQAFMLDLSVSWSTNDPAYKKLTNGPLAYAAQCAMSNDGKDLFVLQKGTGYIYNLAKDDWSVMQNVNFHAGGGTSAATDPESGLIYLPNGAMNFTGSQQLMALDPQTRTISTLPMPDAFNVSSYSSAAWSPPLKSLLLVATYGAGLYSFTPSEKDNASKGWKILNTSGVEHLGNYSPCLVSAYGGTKLVLFAGYRDPKVKSEEGQTPMNAIYVYDVATMLWKEGPSAPFMAGATCAVTGDYFIVWGGRVMYPTPGYGIINNNTLVYNIATDKWTSEYIAPNDSDTSDTKIIIVIVIVTLVLLAMILSIIFVYHRRTRRKPNDQDPKSNGLPPSLVDAEGDANTSGKGLFKGIRRSPSAVIPSDPPTSQKWSVSNLVGRVQQGFLGSRPIPENPHTVVEDLTSRRTVHEGTTFEVELPSQHPHALLEKEYVSKYDVRQRGNKTEWESVDEGVVATKYGDKAEWESIDDRMLTAQPGDKAEWESIKNY
ncbi:MAG: hypothetical protein J3Q66DRAFT_360052 [Benniella sp.]|nr:MAG: hypothetical protein J3Q66DRAFT_360052 [Benniella sp.]